MAKVIIEGRELEAVEGESLLEVARRNGFYIPALCYIDGLPPYAGCRTCIVEVEGARDYQLSCTTKVTDGMVVRLNTPRLVESRKAALSFIMANHSDRCLTCHRRVHCMPGDICLRDLVVTHRCLTCSKNYRCELQRTCELVDTVLYEPWLHEARTYYETPPPRADRANPWLEFDPQMCILCTRCVRACDEIRHTTAIGLADRGYHTHIAFGAGGRVDESNCDFCGACIDACPTATLMEKPNKWYGLADEWISTGCNSCAVGCTLSIGRNEGRPVIVKPDPLNPFSFSQVCVRGRFHYDAVDEHEWLQQPLVHRDRSLQAATWQEALDLTIERLVTIIQEHGTDAVGFLGSPIAANEENYLLQKIARSVAGTNNVDFTAGPVARAVADALEGAFGTEALPADLMDMPRAAALVVVASDLESSHNVASMRAKDAVVYGKARLVAVSARYGELCDFAEVWLKPRPGDEPATVDALARALLQRNDVAVRARKAGISGLEDIAERPLPAGIDATDFSHAVEILASIAAEPEEYVAVVFAPDPVGTFLAGETAKASANLAIACCGVDAPRRLHVMPTDVSVNGARDMGLSPDRLPGRLPLDGSAAGGDVYAMLQAAREGRTKALVVLKDNPMLGSPDKQGVRQALESLEFLVVIDGLLTDTARLATVVLPDLPTYGREGTFTSADRRIERLRSAVTPLGEPRPAWQVLSELGRRLGERLGRSADQFDYVGPSAIMEEIAAAIPDYREAGNAGLASGRTRALRETAEYRPAFQQLASIPVREVTEDRFVLLTGRSLYTSIEGAAIHSSDADKLHREEYVEIHPQDAAALGISDGDEAALVSDQGELVIHAHVSDGVPRGTVFIPLHYDGGAVTSLFPADTNALLLPQVRLAVRTRA